MTAIGNTLSTQAFGWRLERRDGVTLGFTSHDRNVTVGGLTYLTNPGMQPSSIVQSEGLEIGGLDVAGTIAHDAISARDLQNGRWDRAGLQIFLFDWTDPESGQTILATGELGAVSYDDNRFEAEFLGPAHLLSLPAAPTSSPSCRAEFCAKDCGLNIRRFQHLAKVSAITGDSITIADMPQTVPNAFAFGQLRWLTGPLTGLTSEIIASDGPQLQVFGSPALTQAEGDLVLITQGCDHTLESCSQRFANAINFRGEPFLPGNDLLTRYPGA